MPPKPRKVPSYCRHKASGRAVVRLHGRDHYLGPYGSPESHERYEQLIAQWRQDPQQAPLSPAQPSPCGRPISVNELLVAFLRHAQGKYVKHGEPTSEIRSFRAALRPVRQLYGPRAVTDFGPLALADCRQKLVEAGICRKRINQHLGRIRHVFKWGVSRELVPEGVWRALCAVEGVRRGEAVETEPVRPVPESHIKAIETHVTPQVLAMVNLQLWTGCRPGEVCSIRTRDVTTDGPVWEYRPESHKTEHHDRERVIILGPHAQRLVKPWLNADPDAYLFSPREARAWYRAERAKRRQTPARKRKKRKAAPRRAPGERYTTHAYGRAIRRACERADVPPWSPNRLRHNAASRIREAYGLEAARVILGHSSAVTSELYAEFDRAKARRIMRELG